jgi:hypothetical protein
VDGNALHGGLTFLVTNSGMGWVANLPAVSKFGDLDFSETLIAKSTCARKTGGLPENGVYYLTARRQQHGGRLKWRNEIAALTCVLSTAFAFPLGPKGLQPEWDIQKTWSDLRACQSPVAAAGWDRPQGWVSKGAPDTYVTQWNNAKIQAKALPPPRWRSAGTGKTLRRFGDFLPHPGAGLHAVVSG